MTAVGMRTIAAMMAPYTRLAASKQAIRRQLRPEWGRRNEPATAPTPSAPRSSPYPLAPIFRRCVATSGSSAHNALPGTRNSEVRSSIRRTTGAYRTYRPPARSAEANRSGSWVDALDPRVPGDNHDAVRKEGRRIDREDRTDPDAGDQDTGDRRSDGASEVDADRSQRRRGGDLPPGNQLRNPVTDTPARR